MSLIDKFTWEVIPGLPGTGAAPIQFRRVGQSTHSEGLVVQVDLPDEFWIGNFQHGPVGHTGVYRAPRAGFIFVVATGRGYEVPVFTPTDFVLVKSFPIVDVQTVYDSRLVLFIDLTTITAYGPDGWSWQTEPLSWDGINVTAITESEIQGLGWDAPSEKNVPFVVQLDTGHHSGGSGHPRKEKRG